MVDFCQRVFSNVTHRPDRKLVRSTGKPVKDCYWHRRGGFPHTKTSWSEVRWCVWGGSGPRRHNDALAHLLLLHSRAISVILGDKWKKMKSEERRMYTMEAKALAEEQKRLNPDCWKRKRSNSVRTEGDAIVGWGWLYPDSPVVFQQGSQQT